MQIGKLLQQPSPFFVAPRPDQPGFVLMDSLLDNRKQLIQRVAMYRWHTPMMHAGGMPNLP